MSRFLDARRETLPPAVTALAEQLAEAGYKVTGPCLAVLKAASAHAGAFSVQAIEQWLIARFDYLLIDSTGISEPLPVAETFTFADEDGVSLGELARLDTLVTVVDAYSFPEDFQSLDELRDRAMAAGEGDERSVVDLLIDQVEFADVLVLNKADLAAPAALDRLEALPHRLNPEAQILRSSFGQVPLDQLLNTERFDVERAAQSPGWLTELRGEHVPESEAYGIASFV